MAISDGDLTYDDYKENLLEKLGGIANYPFCLFAQTIGIGGRDEWIIATKACDDDPDVYFILDIYKMIPRRSEENIDWKLVYESAISWVEQLQTTALSLLEICKPTADFKNGKLPLWLYWNEKAGKFNCFEGTNDVQWPPIPIGPKYLTVRLELLEKVFTEDQKHELIFQEAEALRLARKAAEAELHRLNIEFEGVAEKMFAQQTSARNAMKALEKHIYRVN